MSTEQPIGNFTILERIKYEHLPYPSREEILDFVYGMDEQIRSDMQLGDEGECDCEEPDMHNVHNSVLRASRAIHTKQYQIHKEIQDIKELIGKILGKYNEQ